MISKIVCDMCGSEHNIKEGRWIFYCPKHKKDDWTKTYDNEMVSTLKNGDFSYFENHLELDDMLLD